MLNAIGISLGALALLALSVAGFAGSSGSEPSTPLKVTCCGQCKPGDDCLTKCKVEGDIPEGLTLTCCGNCEAGDNCLEKCGSGSCCAPR